VQVLGQDGQEFCADLFALMLANTHVHALVLSRAPMGRHWPVFAEEHRARLRIFEVCCRRPSAPLAHRADLAVQRRTKRGFRAVLFSGCLE
jgi:hypothetical protein